ncbi:hypothetical protein ABI59_12345 [Acidobacteria bacterium Mor1]|nr:hypothetical protein ABI59_12345 [Acidobacteria bacterium Mor1]
MLRALLDPQSVAEFEPADWNRLLPTARAAGLLPRLANLLGEAPQGTPLPGKVRDHLRGATNMAAQHERIVRWEVDRVLHALAGLGIDVVLLKGAAYLMAGLPASRGRLVSDVDIMVPKARIEQVEQALLEEGWEATKLDPYDQRYYRQWMHELPPLQHGARQSSLDVHHTILPESGRLHPDPEKLFASARPLELPGLRVLCPEDMVLHSAAHLFQDGDLAGGLRDLCDLDALMRDFAAGDGEFWERLARRAVEMDLSRPAFYALRHTSRILATPVPGGLLEQSAAWGPPAPVRALMDRLVDRALLGDLDRASSRSQAARLALYVRSHYLRMPPGLLVQHLSRKAWQSFEKDDPERDAA